MARKNKALDEGPVNKPVVESPSQKIRQDIANLCTSIGDRSFVIRQANSDITSYYAQIDKLRDELRALEQPPSESPKA
jgi:hypothetical protein